MTEMILALIPRNRERPVFTMPPLWYCPSCPVIIPGQDVADRIEQHTREHG